MTEIIVEAMSLSHGDPATDPSGNVRRPVAAGTFYPADPRQCVAMAASFLSYNQVVAAERKWIGGLVPHAGWVYSGALAGQTIATLAAATPADVVVVFGAIHARVDLQQAALDSYQRWLLPGGNAQIADDVRARLVEQRDSFIVEDRLHVREHAVEVEVPLIQVAYPNALVLPVEVPAVHEAAEIGRRTARTLAAANLRAIFLASSDLTHYGPDYEFEPAGSGLPGMQWAKSNDQPLLELVERLEEERIVGEVQQRHNACGAGAIAAMLAACKEMGASRASILRHAYSYETRPTAATQSLRNAVGYASAVVG